MSACSPPCRCHNNTTHCHLITVSVRVCVSVHARTCCADSISDIPWLLSERSADVRAWTMLDVPCLDVRMWPATVYATALCGSEGGVFHLKGRQFKHCWSVQTHSVLAGAAASKPNRLHHLPFAIPLCLTLNPASLRFHPCQLLYVNVVLYHYQWGHNYLTVSGCQLSYSIGADKQTTGAKSHQLSVLHLQSYMQGMNECPCAV